jgi:hypothetical protein
VSRGFQQLLSDDGAQAGDALDLSGQSIDFAKIHKAAESATDNKPLLLGIRQFFDNRDEIAGRVTARKPTV